MRITRFGRAGLVGWREPLGDRIGEAIGARTRVDPDTVRGLIGLLFLMVTVYYVMRTVRNLSRMAG